jgi:DNA-binding NarL/FixJ family response regulator
MRVLIADDHTLFRQSLKSLLESRDIEVVGDVGRGDEAIEAARRLRPEVVLVDLAMPGLDGLEVTRRLADELPDLRVVVLTASTEDEDLFEAIRAGADGYLRKDLEADRLVTLLEGAVAGQPALTPELSRKVLAAFSRGGRRQAEDPDALTEREKEVLELMVEGATSNRQLARRLGVSENTVKFHVRNILDKLHLHNRAQAVGHALREGLVDRRGRSGRQE